MSQTTPIVIQVKRRPDPEQTPPAAQHGYHEPRSVEADVAQSVPEGHAEDKAECASTGEPGGAKQVIVLASNNVASSYEAATDGVTANGEYVPAQAGMVSISGDDTGMPTIVPNGPLIADGADAQFNVDMAVDKGQAQHTDEVIPNHFETLPSANIAEAGESVLAINANQGGSPCYQDELLSCACPPQQASQAEDPQTGSQGEAQPGTATHAPEREILPPGVLAASEKGDGFSMEELRKAAEHGSQKMLCRAVGVLEGSAVHAPREDSPGVATNSLFICYIAADRRRVQVVTQASMSFVASVACGGAKVVDFALQAEESRLLTAFDNGRVIVSRLTSENAVPRILLKFEEDPAGAVIWHPGNPRIFLTLHSHRALLWHLPLIVEFSTVRPSGYEPLDDEGVQTALRVTDELTEQAACEALPQVSKRPHETSSQGAPATGTEMPVQSHATSEVTSALSRTAFTPDGLYFVASNDNCMWLWRLSAKDEQTLPRTTCQQSFELPKGVKVTHLRFVPRYSSEGSVWYVLVVVSLREVLFHVLDPRPTGGPGYWLPCGKLLCPAQQRLRFPCPVSADVFLPWDSELWPHATLVVLLEENEGAAEDKHSIILAGDLADGEVPDKPFVPVMAAFEVAQLTSSACKHQLSSLRAFERSVRARALPEGAEVHSWAAVALCPAADDIAACQCLALPRQLPESALPPVQEEQAPPVGALTEQKVIGAEVLEPLKEDTVQPGCVKVGAAPDIPLPGFVASSNPAEPFQGIAPNQTSNECSKAGKDTPAMWLLPPRPAAETSFQEASNSSQEVHVADSAEMRIPAPQSAPRESGFTAKRAEPGPTTQRAVDDRDPVDNVMVRNLADFMQKRAQRATDAVFESFKKKLPSAVAQGSSHSGKKKSARRETESDNPTHSAVKRVVRETNELMDHVLKCEQNCRRMLPRLLDVEATKAPSIQKPYKDAIEKELTKLRDGPLCKVVLKAVETRSFGDKFADCLQDAPPEDTEPITQALWPSEKMIQKCLREDLQSWCGSAVAKHFKQLVQDSGIPPIRSAIDGAMKEVDKQGSHTLDGMLEKIRLRADSSRLAEACTNDVMRSLQKEVRTWQDNLGNLIPQKLSESTGGSTSSLGQRFGSRLRKAVLPLQKELDVIAQDVKSAGSVISRCKAAADTELSTEAMLGVTTKFSSSGYAEKAVRAAVANHRIRDAVESALAWDTANHTADLSLVELVCELLQGSGEAGMRQLDEAFDSSSGAGVSGGSKLRMMHVLVQRATMESAPISRTEANLELTFMILQLVDPSDPSITECLEDIQIKMTTALKMIMQGLGPAALTDVGQAERRRLAQLARTAQHGLAMLGATTRR